jgi:hypothetical protein
VANFLKVVGGGPDVVRGHGVLLRVAGEEMRAKASEILSRIQQLEATVPWGTDEYGKSISENVYLREMDHSPANEVMKGWLSDHGKALMELGDAVVAAMTEIQGTELENWVAVAKPGQPD